MRARAQLVEARILLGAGERDAAAQVARALDQAAAGFDELEWRAVAPEVLLARAELAALLGEDAERTRHLREAHRLYSDIGATGHAERLARELERET